VPCHFFNFEKTALALRQKLEVGNYRHWVFLKGLQEAFAHQYNNALPTCKKLDYYTVIGLMTYLSKYYICSGSGHAWW
jgi:hypothetical protein